MASMKAPSTPPRDPMTTDAPPVNGAAVPEPEPPAGPEAEGAAPDGAGVVPAVAVG